MNIFVLNTGRCGSTTFIEACTHISNYSAAHESRVSGLGDERLSYPDNHIEADNRLSWLLGRLDRAYGNQAIYIHLKRNLQATVNSFILRKNFGIMHAYKNGILMGVQDSKPEQIALDYCNTVNSNIALFLKDKTQKMEFSLENCSHDWPVFWELVHANGNYEAALAEFLVIHNAS